ncbi:hypothetical protein ACFYOF_16845 [Streptomyces sp. NPDC007148]|uniref:hypothetical protein n=1 Tax=Streptomyces sp. NPDC007148 TaxID=3364775 RepID=UPI0036A13541
MTGPSSTPRGEHMPAPGANWEAQLVLHGEVLVDRSGETPTFLHRELDTAGPDMNQPLPPRPNRTTRRAIAREARRRKKQGRIEWPTDSASADASTVDQRLVTWLPTQKR